MTLHVELERLAGLGPILQGLADEAAALRTGPAAGPFWTGPGGLEPAVSEACSIASALVDAALVSAVKERLGETGEIMVNVANTFRNADESEVSVADVMEDYTNATGDWDVPEAPR